MDEEYDNLANRSFNEGDEDDDLEDLGQDAIVSKMGKHNSAL